jgi:hypothetical protein
MTSAFDLPSIIAAAARARNLGSRKDLAEPGWAFWELRTLNRHRVVGLLKEYRQFRDGRDLEGEIRRVVSRNFKCAWWRGMAYGVVADVAAISLSLDDLKQLVDIRENSKGTLQWVILLAGNARTALGVHTWMEAYLSPVYRDALQALRDAGYRVTHAKREKDGLMKFLTGVADVEVTLGSLGVRREAFSEFRNKP